MMELRRCAGADELLGLAGAYLAAREAEHNLLFGILGGLRGATRPPAGVYLAVALDGDAVAGVAVRTPPYGPVLSELTDTSVAVLVAEDLALQTHELAGVLGSRDAAERFAARWSELTGARGRRILEEGIYRASSVTYPVGVPGTARSYMPADRELTLAWLAAFAEEAIPHEGTAPDNEEWLERRLTDPDGELLLWVDDDVPVSLAAAGQATPNGLRVGPVYTPPDRRGRGYASAVTAAVTGRALSTGRQYCFLFTDLANPTSNRIYRRLGYERVCDVDQWAFTTG